MAFEERIRILGGPEAQAILGNVGVAGERAFKRVEDATKPLNRGLVGIEAAARDVGERMSGLVTRIPGLTSLLRALGPAGITAAAGIGGIATVVTKATASFAALELQQVKIQAVLDATGNASGQSLEKIQSYSGAIARSSLATGSSVRQAATQLLAFRQVSGDTFERTLRAANALSTAGFGDLVSATVQLGRVLESPVTGMRALRRAAIEFSPAQMEMVKQWAAMGEQSKINDLILGEVEKRLNGVAEAAGDTLAGAWNKVSAATGSFWNTLGSRLGLLDIVKENVASLAGAIDGLAKSMDNSVNAQLRSVDTQIAAAREAAANARENAGQAYPGAERNILEGEAVRAEAELNRLIAQRAALVKQIRDTELSSEYAAAITQRSLAQDKWLERMRLTDEAIKKMNLSQERQLELARMGTEERERQVAADKAEADLRKELEGQVVDPEHIKAVRQAAIEIEKQKQATEALIKAQEELAKSTDDATKKEQERIEKQLEAFRSVEEQAEAINRQTEALRAGGVASEVLQDVMKAENTLRKEGIDLLSEEAKARIEAVRVASEQEAQTKKMIKAAEEHQRKIERSTDDIVSYLGDRFADFATDNEFTWKSMWENMRKTAIAGVARIAAEVALRPIVTNIVANVMGGASGGGGGGFLGGIFGGGGSVGSSSGGGFGGGSFQQLLSLGNNSGILDSLFGPGFSLSGAIDSFGASAFGLSSVSGGGNTLYGLAGLEAGAVDAGFIAGEGAAGLGGASLSGILGGAGLGFGAGTLLNSLVGGNQLGGTIGAGAGALAGAIIGSIVPGIGTIIGGLIGGSGGGLIGGLFGPGKSVGPNGVTLIHTDYSDPNNQRLRVGVTGADNGADPNVTKSAATQLVDVLNNFADQLDLQLTVAAGGIGLAGLFQGNAPGGGGSGGPTSAAAFISNLVGAGGITSAASSELSAAISRIDRSGSGEDILNRIGELVAVYNAINALDLPETLNPEPLTQTEQVLKAIGDAFDELKDKAQGYGLSIGNLEDARAKAIAKVTEGFDDSIQMQILALTDPLAIAMENLERAQKARLDEAVAAGANLVEVERLAGLERAALTAQLANQATSAIKDLYDQLTASTSSPLATMEVLANAEAAFNDVRSRALGGDATAKNELAAIASNLINVSREAFASGPEFFERFNFVLQTLENILGTTQGFAVGTQSAPAGWAWVGEHGPELLNFRGGEQVVPFVSSSNDNHTADQIRAGNAMLAFNMSRVVNLLDGIHDRFRSLENRLVRNQEMMERLLAAPRKVGT